VIVVQGPVNDSCLVLGISTITVPRVSPGLGGAVIVRVVDPVHSPTMVVYGPVNVDRPIPESSGVSTRTVPIVPPRRGGKVNVCVVDPG
jgi:hypothetical protein